jgi:hypothetical protein
MLFPRELEDSAFRSADGEYAWQRSEALAAVRALADKGRAVLGGELWLVRDGEVWGVLPQHSGPPAVYAWETERRPNEAWSAYVARASVEALSAIQALPGEAEVAAPPKAKVYYNLTWVGADE